MKLKYVNMVRRQHVQCRRVLLVLQKLLLDRLVRRGRIDQQSHRKLIRVLVDKNLVRE